MMGYIHKEISNPFIKVQKDEGDTTCSKTAALPLHALTVSLLIQNNTTHSRVTMLSFIGEIPWENTTVNPLPWVRKHLGYKQN